MSVHEEVEEHIHHAQGQFDKLVAGCMAIIAALLAVVSVLGTHYETEELLLQQKASDQWAYYQAKDIRRYVAQMSGDILLQMKADQNIGKRYADDSARYKQQTADIQDKARDLEKERDKASGQTDSFHLGEVFLELAIVLASLSILTKRRPLFYGALVSALIGVLISGGGFYWFAQIHHA